MTFILGLTGSIGMGKSTTAEMFRAEGVPVHDADASVHALYRGRAAGPVGAAFPGTVSEGVVDRALLSKAVLGKPDEIRRLEAIIHPLVRQEEQAFLAHCRVGKRPLCVLDIPLLYETGGETRCDAVVVVTAPADVQRARVLARPGMTPDKFETILARQLPDAEKRRRADYLVDTAQGLVAAKAQVRSILAALAGRAGRFDGA